MPNTTTSTVLGTSGNDTILAVANNESIDGQGGNDSLSSIGAGGTVFNGDVLDNRNGSHNHFIVGGNSGATVIGSETGNDTMSVSLVNGTAGTFDFLDAQQGGNDSVTDNGGTSNVEAWLHGAVGIINQIGNDTVNLGNGNDTVTTGGDHGTTGHNSITLGNGNDVVDGFFSTGDTINVAMGSTTLSHDVIYPGLGGGHTINLGANAYALVMAVGSETGDTINAASGPGADTINTGAGNSLINSNGHDLVYFTDTTTGHDTLNAGSGGHDTVGYNFSPSAVLLNLTDSVGNSTIGSHTQVLNNTGNINTFDLTQHGNDTVNITGAHSYGIFGGGTGNDILNAAASTGNETLYGDSGNDTITTGTGLNVLDGVGGANVINSNGHDFIYSGTGGSTGNTINVNAGSNDTISYDFDGGKAVNINLLANTATASGFTDTYHVASAGAITSAIGSTGNDTITGTYAGGQILSGDGAGSDIITHASAFPATAYVTTSSAGAGLYASGTNGLDPAPLFSGGGTAATYYPSQGDGGLFPAINPNNNGFYEYNDASGVSSSTEGVVKFSQNVDAVTLNVGTVEFETGGVISVDAFAANGSLAFTQSFAPTSNGSYTFNFTNAQNITEFTFWGYWGGVEGTSGSFQVNSVGATFANSIKTAGDVLDGSGTGNSTLNAGAASDTLMGGSGNDLFSFKNGVVGQAVINNFHVGDHIEIAAPARITSTLISGITNDGHGDAMINLPSGATIEVVGAAAHTFTASDFLFT